MLRQSLSRSAAAVTFAGVLLLGGAPAALASSPVLVASPHADGGSMPDDHGSMPGMDHGSMPGTDHGSTPDADHGSTPGTGHGSMPGTEQHPRTEHATTADPAAGHDAGGAAASPVRPQGLVLGAFAGFNAAVMAAAAVVRRRTAGRRDHRRSRRAGAVPA